MPTMIRPMPTGRAAVRKSSIGTSWRDGAGCPPHEPEVRPPVGEVPLDGDLEAVPLVERHVPRLLSEQLALDAVLVDAREPRSQQQASQTEALPRGVHADQDEIPVRNGLGSPADAIMVLDHRVAARSCPVAERADNRGQPRPVSLLLA